MRPDTGRMGVEETYKGVGNVSTVRASRPVVTAWAPEDATSPRGVERRVETCFFEADGLTGLDPCARVSGSSCISEDIEIYTQG